MTLVLQIITLIGSVAMLMYGLKVMSEGLQKMAGSTLSNVLGTMTTNRFSGVLTGAFITAAVQSSTATTVMTVSFVSAGILSLALETNMKQIFESDKISFVEVSECLVNDYLTMVNDYENVNRFIGGKKKSFTVEQELQWVQEKLEEKALVFSMIDKASGRFIGNIELMDPNDSEGELGIAITAEMQDQGHGTEAVLAMVNYAIDHLGLKRVFLRTNPQNARAIRVYEKCGFRKYKQDSEHVYMEVMR